jgi:hypothetical protein
MPSLPPLVDRTRLAPAATRVSPTSWPLTPVAEPAGSLKPRRAHTPSGPRQSADDAQQQQLLERPRDTERKTHRAMSGICCQDDTALRVRDAAACPHAPGPPPFAQGTRAPSSLWRVAPATPHTAIHSGRLRPVRYPIGASAARGGCHLAGRGWIAAPQLDLRFGGAGCRCLLGRCSARRAPLAGV